MNCKKWQDLILTDFFDEELDIQMQKNIQAHISSCHDCKEFANIARKAVIEPFKNLERAVPPESVWERIKEEIIEDQLNEQPNVFTQLKNLLFPRYGYALGAITCLILMLFVFNSDLRQTNLVMNDNPPAQRNYLPAVEESQLNFAEEIEFVASLINENNDSEDYGTSIEEYFL